MENTKNRRWNLRSSKKLKAIKKSKSPIITKPKKNKKVNRSTPQIKTLLYNLNSTTSTDKLVGRKDQIDQINKFISLKSQNQSSKVLLISGPPGTGKTAFVTKILQNSHSKFSCGMINAMQYTKRSEFYTAIYRSVLGDSKTKKSPPKCDKIGPLKELLMATKTPILLVIDEIDHLLFTEKGSSFNLHGVLTLSDLENLVLIGISNTIKIPQTPQPTQIQPLIFEPYTEAEIFSIVKNRIVDFRLFDELSIRFLAKKISSDSGDIRKALEICRKALAKSQIAKRISLPFIKKILSDCKANSSLEKRVKALPKKQQIVLCALLLRAKEEKENAAFRFTEFLRFYSESCRKTALPNTPAEEVRRAVDFLAACGLVKRKGRGDFSVELCASVDELETVFSGDVVFGSILNGK